MLELKPNFHRPRVIRRRPRLLALPFVLAIITSPAVASAGRLAESMPVATKPAATPNVASGPLRIEIDRTIDDANLLSGWILERDLGVTKEIPLVEGHEQWVAVQIGGATYEYRVSVTPMRDGAPLDPAKGPEVCECNSEALLILLDERIAAAAAELRARPPDESHEPESTHDPFGNETVVDEPRRRVRTLGSVGIGVAVLGAGLLSAGIPLMLRDDEFHGGAWQAPATRSTHGYGIGMAVGGGVALVAGVSLLAVDLVRQRQRRVAVAPTWGPQHAGLVVAWKLGGRVIR